MRNNKFYNLGYDVLAFIFVLLVFLKLLPLAYGGIYANLSLAILYIFSVYYSRYTHAVAIFFVGFIFDIADGRMIGINAFLWTFWFGVLFSQKRFLAANNFIACWMTFSAFVVLFNLTEWFFIRSIIELPFHFSAMQTLLEIAIYPMVFKMVLFYERPQTVR